VSRWLAGVAALAAAALVTADEPPLPEVAAALARIKDHSSIELTTTGRRTGKPHTRPVWFVVSDAKVLLQAGHDGKTDWYRNLAKKPSVSLRSGSYTFRGRAVTVADPARVEEIHRLFLRKYTTAWLLSFVGSSIGRGRPVEVTPWSVSEARP
jgi:deazaflavin-dependent oxidoreductase (nitroreductase family)